MLAGVVSHSSRRGKNEDRRIGTKEIEKRKRAQINLSCSTDTTHKGDGPWSNRTLQEVLKFRSG